MVHLTPYSSPAEADIMTLYTKFGEREFMISQIDDGELELGIKNLSGRGIIKKVRKLEKIYVWRLSSQYVEYYCKNRADVC